jgi:hypothetical protein
MRLFEEIVRSLLLTEDVSVNRVNDSINNTYEVEINYHSKGEDIATGKRIIQPHAYGLTKAGNPVIRAFQPYGDTTTSVPSWKFFRLDRIDNWTPYPERKFTQAPGNFPAEGEFNPDGDKTMSVVYNIADFGNRTAPDYSFRDKTGPVRKNNIPFKTPTERGLSNLQKQLKDPKYIADLVGTKNFGDADKNKVNNEPVRKPETTPEPQQPITQQTINNEPEPYKTDTERDIERRREQLNNPQYVSQDVLDRYNREKNNRNTNNRR